MKKIIIYGLFLLIGSGMLFVPIQSGFYLTDREGQTLYFLPDQVKRITIGWRHSVELTPWEENYNVIAKNMLALESSVYKAYGAGTPDVEGEAEILSNGYIKVTGIERLISEYSLFYVPTSGYYLKHNKKTYELKGLVEDFTNVQINYGSLRIYQWLYLKFNQIQQKEPRFLKKQDEYSFL